MKLITEVPTSTVKIPTINDDLKDFDRLFQIQQQVSQKHSEIFLDFSKCYFLRQNAVAFIGGLIRLFESQGRTVNLKWNTLHKKIARNLQQNGFMHVFNNDYAIIDKCNESYQVRKTFFEGTLVNITLKCDESYYYLVECNPDLDDEPLF